MRDFQLLEKVNDRWTVFRKHEGGMGVVYIVYDDQYTMFLAAKSFQLRFLDPHSSVYKRFWQEAESWIKLDYGSRRRGTS